MQHVGAERAACELREELPGLAGAHLLVDVMVVRGGGERHAVGGKSWRAG